MLKQKPCDLSVIIVSSRAKWLANCLNQFQRQSFGDLSVERIVVCEGNDPMFGSVCDKYGVKSCILKSEEGLAGAYGKDIGLKYANGEYVCFWDDDNVYYDHALATLYASAVGFDIGVVQCGVMAFNFRNIPGRHEIQFAEIDTMCFCVKRSLALQERWSDHKAPGTDFSWLTRLRDRGASIRFVDIKIGEHLNN